ncbi:MAG: sigma-70 family RNA polymerase sigma factor [Oscillospiraceae bacterium]|nr:sigma-70 family RNA polymerase sigma factor [Oscillospiraceae bacterium]
MCIYAKCRLGDDELAEEAVQETFRVACERQEQVITSENPRGWMMETLKYTIRSIMRERVYLNKLYTILRGEGTSDELTDENVDIMYSDIIKEEDFEMLKMIVLGNCTLKDTAEHFGITYGACRKRISRLKQRLQKILAEEEV